MEDNDDQRDNEIVAMPTDHDEAHEMLNKVEGLLDKFTVTSGRIYGSTDQGFGFN